MAAVAKGNVSSETEVAPASTTISQTGDEPLSPMIEAMLPAHSLDVDTSQKGELARAAEVGMRTARVVSIDRDGAMLMLRGVTTPVFAEIGPEVEDELLRDARENGQSVLVEISPGLPPVVVGVVQTRAPRELTIRANRVTIEADEEVLLRSGRGAVRLRSDGDIEVIGSRISAASRGLFRIVGRMLRLN